MKTAKVLVFSTLMALNLGALNAHASDIKFSVEAWAQDLKSSLAKKDAKEIARLLDLTQIENKALETSASGDRAAMKKGRDLFTANKFEESIAAYNQVSKESDFWLEAVEEKAWAYVRLNEIDKALAQTKTLMSPVFNSIVGSEPFFLRSLSQLRICDYKGVFETDELFKKSQRARIKEMQNLADTGTSSAVDSAISKIRTIPVTITDMGNDVKMLPRLIYRDREFLKSALHLKMVDAALSSLRQARAEGTSAAIVQKAIERLETNEKIARIAVKERVKELAQVETNENFKMLQKLNLIEVETIQRVHIDQGADKKAYTKGAVVKAGPNDLVFRDDGHPWIDELDKYQVQTNSCPQNLRRRM
jgi:hypothetical protein